MNKSSIILLAISLTATRADNLEPLGDEFSSAVTQSQWTRLNDTEGWNADQLELWQVNPSHTPGHMVMAPYSSAWFMDLRGVLVYKEITGDFICTLRMRVNRRGVGGTLPSEAGFVSQAGAPSRQFSLAGIFLRNPRNITQAAPDPIPAGSPSWPPPIQGQAGHFTTDWTPDGDNYLFLSFGSAGNQGTWQYEVKTTSNGNSNLYYNNHGIPVDDAQAQYVTLQMIKVGDTIVTLRKHDTGPWIIENRYTPTPASPYQQLPNFGDTLQIGITTYTDWNSIGSYYAGGDHASQYEHNYTVFNDAANAPDLIAHADYIRFQRPDPALTEATLQALPITFQPSPLGGSAAVQLPNTGTGIMLGDNAHSPAPGLNDDPDNDGHPNIFEAIMGTDPNSPNTSPLTQSITPTHFELTFPHQNNLADLTLEIQRSSTLADGSWSTVATRTSSGWTFAVPHSVTENATTIQFSTPLPTSRHFYRLRATSP